MKEMFTPKKLFLILLVCIAAFFFNLHVFEPDLMEARNFTTAREMISDNNWIIPTMNGELRLEKQPLVTWFTACSAMLGNSMTNLAILRLPSALAATLMVLFFYGICFELTRKRDFAFIGAIIFATSLLVVQMARVNSWDIFTHSFMTGSIWLLLRAMLREERKLFTWLFAALLMGLSFFSKGPVGFYAMWLPFIIAFAMTGNRVKFKRNIPQLLVMLVVAAVIGFAWNAYIYLAIPEDFKKIIVQEASARGSRHIRPFYFYLHFPAYIGIWTVPLLAAFFYRPLRRKVMASGYFGFTLIWLLSGLILLSVIPEKKERYMLPLEVPMCLMVAFLIHAIYLEFVHGTETIKEIVLTRLQGILVGLLFMALPVISFMVLKSDILSVFYLVPSAACAVLAVVVIKNSIWQKGLRSFLAIMYGSVALVLFITVFYLPVMGKKVYGTSFSDIAMIQSDNNLMSLPFISAGELNMKVIWRIGKPVKPVDLTNYEFKQHEKAVVFSYTPLNKLMGNEKLSQLNVHHAGSFDCNRGEKNCNVYVNVVEKN